MRGNRALMATAGAIAALTAFVNPLPCSADKKIEKHGPATMAPVQGTIPTNVSRLVTAIRETFNVGKSLGSAAKNKFPETERWNHFYLFAPGEPIFPSDDLIRLNRGVDSFILRYLTIPAESRRNDFYLYEATGDYYWASEYSYDEMPAKFRCAFFIHLESAGKSATRVEIFEYQPTIWVGEKIAAARHGLPLPGRYHDIRSAEATTADREELLKKVRDMAGARSRP